MSDYQLKQVCLAMKLRKMFVRCNFVTNQMKLLIFRARGIRKMPNVKVVRDNLKL